MSKKVIILLVIFMILVIGAIIYISRGKEKTVSPVSNKKVSPTSAAKKMKEYTDPSGFKFNYPDDLEVLAKDVSTSNTLYADIIITATASGRKGQITITAEDTTKTFFDEAFKDKTTIETKLGDVDAYQYQEKSKLITTAYDQGVRFTLTTDLSQEKSYWFGVNKQIVNSFEFIQPETSTQSTDNSSNSSGDEIIFEGEETIE